MIHSKKLNLLVLSLLCSIVLSVAQNKQTLQVLLAGDISMAGKPSMRVGVDSVSGETIKEKSNERGWGMVISDFFTPNVVFNNLAVSNQSTFSFIKDRRWSALEVQIQKGTYIVLQFGLNDQLKKPGTFTSPTDFKFYLTKFIDETKERGGIPIICTPIPRCVFESDGKTLSNTLHIYPDVATQVAKEKKVILIDLNKHITELFNSIGEEQASLYFANIAPGTSKIYPDGLKETLVLNQSGAELVAKTFVEELQKQKVRPLVKQIKK